MTIYSRRGEDHADPLTPPKEALYGAIRPLYDLGHQGGGRNLSWCPILVTVTMLADCPLAG